MRSVIRKQCSTRFHVQTQPLPVCTWHANPPELSARHCVAIQSVGVVRSCVRIGKPKGRQAHANPYVSARLPSSGPTTYDSIKEHPCGPPPGLGLAANLGGRSPEPKKKTRSLQLLQAYWSPVHPYIGKDKADLGHFSVQKVFSGFGIVRSNSKQPRSSKNTINYRGEILYPLLNI